MGIFSADKLTPLGSVRAGHMVFVTAVAFAPDSCALLSVSADASARSTPTRGAAGLAPTSWTSWLLLLLTLLVALLAVIAQLLRTRGSA